MAEFIKVADEKTPDAPDIPVAHLRAHARAAAHAWSVTRRPQGRSIFAARVEASRNSLDALNDSLDRLPPPDYSKITGPDPILELRENPRLLRSVVLEAASIRRKADRLPRVLGAPPAGDASELPRDSAIAAAYLDATNSIWSAEAFHIYAEQLQREEPLELEELWKLPTFFKFHLLEQILTQAAELLRSPETIGADSRRMLSTRIKALREIGYADWVSLLESLIVFDATLRQDPAQSYAHMDFETREMYRKRVAEVARYSDCTELQVAGIALELARAAQKQSIADPRLYLRRSHIGYYLVDRGFPQLAPRIGYRPRFFDRLRTFVRNNADDFYIGGIEIVTILLMAVVIAPLVPKYPVIGGLTLGFFLLLLPAAQGAVDLFNNVITALFKAQPLAKLDFANGIPAEFCTLVAVPTLLMSEKQVRELVDELEIRFLANPDPNLHFGLLTDLPDSVTKPGENDSDPLVDLAIHLIEGLNSHYHSGRHGSFFLLHRHRIFNARQGVWMGWERKRGKLLDLNKYLKGEFDAFPVKAGNLNTLHQVRYIITLDSDTQLPRGTSNQLIGAMAHPLNRAIIDPELRIVTEGYGIMQPRVGVSVSSATRSRLAAIYSGQTGFDIYSRAISDAYQDLYGEGIFTGKGIYEVSSFHAVLDRRFPRNSLLSHDLIEGSYARVGLATDIEVIDDYPSHYSAYTRRKHRWVRGDWQIAQWMFSKVPDESGRPVRNPISTISRWRILDNLRRSLVEPFTFLLLVAGWLGLPGGPLYWLLATLFIFFLPVLVQLAFSLGRALFAEEEGAIGEAFSGFFQALGVALLTLAFLPHQTLLSVDAIVRSLVRRFITGQRLLEWETAAEAEANTRRRTPVDNYLAAMPVIAIALAAMIFFFNWGALHIAAPVLILWAFAGPITRWLNSPPREQRARLSREEDSFLRQQALRIWRFYAEFGGEKHNYLIPDNVEEDGLVEAPRVSTTNIGMLLNARQAASEFGFLTAPEFAELTARTLASIGKLEKLKGHPYNWYDTESLKPLTPITISSVDNGNLAASLYTLRAGAEAMLKAPLLSQRLFDGLRMHWQLLLLQKEISAEIASHPVPAAEAALEDWINWSLSAETLPAWATHAEFSGEAAWWLRETQQRIAAINVVLRKYLPWWLPEFAPLRALPQLGLDIKVPRTLIAASEFAGQLEARLARTSVTLFGESGSMPLNAVLCEHLREQIRPARENLRSLTASIQAIAGDSFRIADEMDFGFLLEKSRLLLSIGYEVATQKLHQATYDMLASEARIATFIAVAKGEIPQQAWFKLGRTHTIAFNRPVLLSWTGTMFEYLMPSLWMRSYPDTLVSRTLSAAVEIQRAFARKLGIPWGISESGYAQKDPAGHYHYQAYGIPQLALKWDATAGPVVSPYSSFLALGTDAAEALRNLTRMAKAGWIGAYGFYEAADYSEPGSARGKPNRALLVREWMAHHQGMSLLAILNLLHENIVQTWFHSNPQFQASELLLHEKPLREAALRAEHKQFASKHRGSHG